MKNNINLKIIIGSLIALGVVIAVLFFRGYFDARKIVIDMDDSAEEIVVEEGIVSNEEDQYDSEVVAEENLPATNFPEFPQTDVQQPTKQAKPAVENKNDLKIVDKLVNFGFQSASKRSIDTIIIHSSYDAIGSELYNIDGIIQEYKDYGVSAHYLIGRDGTIYQLVREKDIAYHAGVSSVPDGRTGVNGFSIGIEMVNTKVDKLTKQQYAALNDLIVDIKNRYEIRYVLGHNQIAPERKDDPWNFDWDRLE